jgi:Ca-activated chloride channel homolog
MKLKPLNKKALIESVQSIHPKGKTPIAASMRLAVDQLKELEDETTIILISDGQETCDPDPCAVVQQLKDTGIKFILHVIGFDLMSTKKSGVSWSAWRRLGVESMFRLPQREN